MRAKYSEMHHGSDLAFYHMSPSLGPAHIYTHKKQQHESWVKFGLLSAMCVLRGGVYFMEPFSESFSLVRV